VAAAQAAGKEPPKPKPPGWKEERISIQRTVGRKAPVKYYITGAWGGGTHGQYTAVCCQLAARFSRAGRCRPTFPGKILRGATWLKALQDAAGPASLAPRPPTSIWAPTSHSPAHLPAPTCHSPACLPACCRQGACAQAGLGACGGCHLPGQDLAVQEVALQGRVCVWPHGIGTRGKGSIWPAGQRSAALGPASARTFDPFRVLHLPEVLSRVPAAMLVSP
jgi:hypothetical protein